MRVVWTRQAFERLAEIEDFIARDNPRAAKNHTERLIARTEPSPHTRNSAALCQSFPVALFGN